MRFHRTLIVIVILSILLLLTDTFIVTASIMFAPNVGQRQKNGRFPVQGDSGGTIRLANDARWLSVMEPDSQGRTSRVQKPGKMVQSVSTKRAQSADAADNHPDLRYSTILDGDAFAAKLVMDGTGSVSLYLPMVMVSIPVRQAVTLTAVSDATILEGRPSLNFGDTDNMWVGYDDKSDPDGKIARGLIKFDVSHLPHGAHVQEATLRIYYKGYWDFPGYVDTITAYQARGHWQEMHVTWQNKPGFGNRYGRVRITADNNWGWRQLSVTDLVQSWLDGSIENDGVMLRGEEASGTNSSRRSFYTREGKHPPQLVIQFTGLATMQNR